MKLIKFLVSLSWQNMVIAGLTGSVSGLCSAWLIALINQGIAAPKESLNQILWGFIGLAVVALVTNLISHFLLSSLSYDAIYQLRLRLSNGVLNCPLRHLEQLGANRILATLTEDTNSLADTIYAVPYLFVEVALIVGSLVYLCYLSWQVFLITAGFLLLAILIINFLVSKADHFIELARKQQDELFKHFRTLTEGIKELKLHHPRRQSFLLDELQASAKKSRQYDTLSVRIYSFSDSISQLLFFVVSGLVVFVLPQLTITNTTMLSGYVLVITYLAEPFQRLVGMLSGLNRGNVALENINKLGLSVAQEAENVAYQLDSLNFSHSLQLENVIYIYDGIEGEKFSLGPLSLEINVGEMIFIVGGNGSGKSTLAKLLTGLYVPSQGEIRLDGQIITEENRESYRQLFSTVFADFYLFDRLIGLDLPDLDSKANYYLRQLQLGHKVEIKEGKFSTLNLSQGQRKRLALLTAYLESRSIYLFDEWAADQDPAFRELFYHQLLPQLRAQGKTLLVITHDDRYFHLADKVLKLDYGKLV